MKAFGLPDVDAVTRLILCTKHDRPPRTPDGRLIVDVDLSILGQGPDVFDAYDAAIRREYAHVPDAAFAAGRAAVLRRFLDRPTIYATKFFQQRYERPARENLQRAIARWEKRA
jgi:predicted metal-dependent HD superfamily phosphohydrolase